MPDSRGLAAVGPWPATGQLCDSPRCVIPWADPITDSDRCPRTGAGWWLPAPAVPAGWATIRRCCVPRVLPDHVVKPLPPPAPRFWSEALGWSGAIRTPLHPSDPTQWLTAGLTVDPAFRRRGIGHRLLQAVIEAIGALHGDTLHSVVNARNAPSLALHRSLGFTALETGPRFAGIEFGGGVGVLLTRPTGVSAQPRRVLTLRP